MNEDAEMVCGAVYQIFASVASDFGIFEHPDVQRVLTALSSQEYDDTLLPWHSRTPEQWKQEADSAEPSTDHLMFLGPFPSKDNGL